MANFKWWDGVDRSSTATRAGPTQYEEHLSLETRLTFTVWSGTIDDDSRAGEDCLIIVLCNGSVGSVNTIPNRNGQRRPMDKVFGDKVTVVRTMTRRRSKVDLIKMVDHTVNWIKHGSIWIVLPASLSSLNLYSRVSTIDKTTQTSKESPDQRDYTTESTPFPTTTNMLVH